MAYLTYSRMACRSFWASQDTDNRSDYFRHRLFLFSQVNTIPVYFLAFILIALGSSLGGWATLMVPIVHWFDQHRAKAIAWSQLGFPRRLCATYGNWLGKFRLALYGYSFGCSHLAAGLPLVSLIHHRPSDKGLTVDGYGQKEAGQTTTKIKSQSAALPGAKP